VSAALPLLLLCLLAGVGCYLDVRFRRLPNWLCVGIAAAGLASIAAVQSPAWPWSGPAHAVVALLVGMGLFAAGFLGAGDAKFYAALAMWFPLGSAPLFAALIGLAGLLLAILWFALRPVLSSSGGGSRHPDFAKLPYGVAIAGGAMILGALEFGGST
jgi:prepilin peptidase CpaA